jgi:hypothetical protein
MKTLYEQLRSKVNVALGTKQNKDIDLQMILRAIKKSDVTNGLHWYGIDDAGILIRISECAVKNWTSGDVWTTGIQFDLTKPVEQQSDEILSFLLEIIK